MIRLFTAIDIPESIEQEIRGMGRAIPNARPVPTDQFHLTLKFIGEVEGSCFLDIRESLKEIVHPRFSLALKGVGTFPPRGTPRILFAGVEPAAGIAALRNAIEKNLGAIGIAREKRKYTPHLTLARLNNCPLRHLHNYLAGNAFFQTPQFTVENFHLYSSRLTAKGAQHTLESSYPLT